MNAAGGAGENQLLESALDGFARATKLPLVFGGYQREGVAVVTAISGNRTQSLDQLRIEAGRGLGGQAIKESRPRFTADYEHSKLITHDYDAQVLHEGVHSLVAVPVLVDGDVRAILYGGAYDRATLATVMQRPVVEVVNEFARQLHDRDEAMRRGVAAPTEAPSPEMPSPLLEELRSSYAEIRSIANSVDDPMLRSKLATLESRLARLSGASGEPQESSVHLTPRELDVLSQVALGRSNAEAGRELGLTESTVKAYMKAAASKLGCSNRHAAVAAARREGLIP